MRLLPAGPAAVMAEFDDLDRAMAAAAAVRARAIAGVVDVVPGARTVLVVHHGADTRAIEQVLGDPAAGVAAAASVRRGARTVVLPTTYDGADLEEVSRACSLTVAEVIDLHTSTPFTVAFCGFMPGFAYLVGLPAVLQLPRRTSPRPRVPAGSVAIGGEFAGVYPLASPGGWHLLGHCATPLWDEQSEHPALLEPGATVRFEAC